MLLFSIFFHLVTTVKRLLVFVCLAACFWFLSFFWWRCGWVWAFALFAPYSITAHILWRAPALFQIPPLTIERKQIKIARIRDPFKNKGFGRLVWHQCCCCCCWQKDMRLKTGKTWQDQSCYEPCKVLARADVHVWKPAVYRNEWNISTHFAPVASGQ